MGVGLGISISIALPMRLISESEGQREVSLTLRWNGCHPKDMYMQNKVAAVKLFRYPCPMLSAQTGDKVDFTVCVSNVKAVKGDCCKTLWVSLSALEVGSVTHVISETRNYLQLLILVMGAGILPPKATKAEDRFIPRTSAMVASPNRPPKTAFSPAFLPGTGINRTPIVL